jgi:glyceraldehyde 3-phosphate dehydrogenase
MSAPRTLGINGLGRIGKLTLWYHLGHDSFDRFVVNVGRPVGKSLSAVVEYIGKDSTYGPLHRYLDGHKGRPDIQVIDEGAGLIRAHGKEIVLLREARNPKDIPWRAHGITLVVDCTGKFTDPHADADDPKGGGPAAPPPPGGGGGVVTPRQSEPACGAEEV